MRKAVGAAIAGVLIGTASTALATTNAVWHHRSNNVACTMRTTYGGTAACVNTRSWGVGIASNYVIVIDSNGQEVFRRFLPGAP